MKNTWHIIKETHCVTVARRLPARFDLSAQAPLPRADKLRVAQQVRQDLWRALQDQRGFSPVVEVREDAGQLMIRAGGQCDRAFPRQGLEAQIADLLSDPNKRERWVRYAQKKTQKTIQRNTQNKTEQSAHKDHLENAPGFGCGHKGMVDV